MCLGIPGQIIEITNQNHKLAIVNIAGVKRQINIACIVDEQHPPESCIGDWVLVHVGFAMNRINEKEALETLQMLQEIANNCCLLFGTTNNQLPSTN
ncbi:hydrogenase assembly protein HupF [Fischerella thermalis CCMEE 5273]|nr:hydrogenase assembly protein HupF [Fischerella thermalis CCMEE 5273]